MFMVRIKLLLVVILVSMVRNKSMGAKKSCHVKEVQRI